MNIGKSLMIGALASCGLATAAYSADSPSPPGQDAPAWHSLRHAHAMHEVDGPFLHAVHQLNLTAEQSKTIEGYLQAARQQHMADASSRPDMSVLANPGDPGYTNAIVAAKTKAADMIQQRSDLDLKVYGVLTAAQKAQLPQVLADMKAKHEMQHSKKEFTSQPATAG